MVWYQKIFIVLVTGLTSLKEERVFLVAILPVSYSICHSHQLYNNTTCIGIFTGFVYLSLYLATKLMVFNQSGRGHSLRLLLVLTPLLVAVMIAISRVRDYWHHWEGDNNNYYSN